MVILGGLVPHPPLLIPAVGGARVDSVARTSAGLDDLCRQVAASGARRLVLITPHGPYQHRRMSCLYSPHLEGDLSRFGCPEVRESWPCDLDFCRSLPDVDRVQGTLDHALLVPLYFLRRNGFVAPVCALGISGLSRASHLALGAAVAEASGSTPTVVLASGDLSHRLKADGPYGFDPQGPIFDREVVSHLEPLQPQALIDLPQDLVEGAGVCGMKPLMVLLGAVPPGSRGRVLSYEGPFGVGYAVASMEP